MRRSSFVRKGAVAASDLGTRPGLHGQSLASSGHAELDRVLGGGLPLGSLLLILEDGSSRHHATLLRYFLGEGAACGQSTMLAAAAVPPGGLAQFVPQQLKRSAAPRQEEEKEEQEEHTLRIAWQYRRYLKPAAQRGGPASKHSPGADETSHAVGSPPAGAAADGGVGGGGAGPAGAAVQRSSSGGGGGRRVRIAAPEPGAEHGGRPRDWCHQFDLGRGLGEDALAQCRVALLDCQGEQPMGRLVAGVAEFVGALDQEPATAAASATAPLESSSSTTTSAPEGRAMASPAAAGAAEQVQPGEQQRHLLLPRTQLPPVAAAPLRSTRQVGRLAVLSLASPGWWPAVAGPGPGPEHLGARGAGAGAGLGGGASWDPGREALRALVRLKAAVREARAAVVVATLPAALLGASCCARCAHLADAVLALEAVADDSDIFRLAPDPASVAGLLHVRKLPSLGTLAAPGPEVSLYLIRNKRRRLSITPVEIDPDAEAGLADGAGAGASGSRGPAASHLCGGPSQGGSSVLDF